MQHGKQTIMQYGYSKSMSYVKLNLCEMYKYRMKRETKVKRRILVFFQTIVSVDLRRFCPPR